MRFTELNIWGNLEHFCKESGLEIHPVLDEGRVREVVSRYIKGHTGEVPTFLNYGKYVVEDGCPVLTWHTSPGLWEKKFPQLSTENLKEMCLEIEALSPPVKADLGRRVALMPIPPWISASMSSLLDLGGSDVSECHPTTMWLWEDEAKTVAKEFVAELKRLGLAE